MDKAKNTRSYILQKSYDLIHKNGFQATSLDRILETTNVTKGAFYYHFKSKNEMGLALINELIIPPFQSALITPLNDTKNSLKNIHETIQNHLLSLSPENLSDGCPVGNLIQETASVNDDFKQTLLAIIEQWRLALIENLQQAEKTGLILRGHDLSGISNYIISSYQGIRILSKLDQNQVVIKLFLQQLKNYLGSL